MATVADLVPFARSAMDGFAVSAADVAAAPVELPLRARLFAGLGDTEHAPNTVTAIATGAPIPRGADAVLRSKMSRRAMTSCASRVVPAGIHVFPQARTRAPASRSSRRERCCVRRRSVYLQPPATRTSTSIANRRAHSSAPATPFESEPAYGQIRNSNAAVIAATVEGFGAPVVAIETVGDDRVVLSRALEEAFDAADLVLTTGGASVGERDLVKPMLDELGVVFAFRSVAVRPAKPSAFGMRGDVRVGVLPGNPSSAFVASQELIRPVALALAGRRDPLLPRVIARLEGTTRAKPALTYASYAQVRVAEHGFVVRPLINQCSALTRTASVADGFIVVPPGSVTFATGAQVDVDVFDWTAVATG